MIHGLEYLPVSILRTFEIYDIWYSGYSIKALINEVPPVEAPRYHPGISPTLLVEEVNTLICKAWMKPQQVTLLLARQDHAYLLHGLPTESQALLQQEAWPA